VFHVSKIRKRREKSRGKKQMKGMVRHMNRLYINIINISRLVLILVFFRIGFIAVAFRIIQVIFFFFFLVLLLVVLLLVRLFMGKLAV
jgi:hypothetical protein